MKVKAKIVTNYCVKKRKECGHTDISGCLVEEPNCENYIKYGDSCLYYGIKEIFIDKEYKNIEIDYNDAWYDIRLKIGNKLYFNDNYCCEIEYLYLDNKPIVENYKRIKDI